MQIENYSDKYFLDVMKLVENFHKEALHKYEGPFNSNAIIEMIKAGNPENAFLLIADGSCHGMIYGLRANSPTSGELIYQEMIWYVNPKYRKSGIALFKYAEKSLKESGVSLIIMAVLENSKTEKIKRFYDRLGYKPIETHYMRKL